MRTWPNSFTKMTVETDLSGPPWKAGLPGGSVTKNLPANAGDPLRSLDQEDPPGEGNGSPLQYSWLRNPTDRGCWLAMVHGFAKSWTWLRDWRLGTPRKACVCVCVCVRMRGSKYHGLSFLAFHSKRVHRLIQRKIHLGVLSTAVDRWMWAEMEQIKWWLVFTEQVSCGPFNCFYLLSKLILSASSVLTVNI